MSVSEEDVVDATSLNVSSQKKKRETSEKKDVFELFTVKSSPAHTTKYRNSKFSGTESQDSTELSDDVFVKPRPVSSSTPSKSDTKSYRDRINERFRSVKKQARNSSNMANTFKETAERIILDKIRRESHDIDAEVELMKNRFKLGQSTRADKVNDFFCKENPPELDLETQNEDREKSADALSKNEAVQKFSPPDNLFSVLMSTEEDFLFKAKAQPVDIYDKIENDSPRYEEEEGLYIPKMPNVPSKHIHFLEQRLSRDNKKWFNSEGNLKIVESPMQKTCFRPNHKTLSSHETAVYFPGKIEVNNCEEVIIMSENILQLNVATLKFMHHPLFSMEHVFERKLRQLYAEYEKDVSKNTMNRFKCRLQAVRHALKKNEETSSQSGEQSDKEEDTIIEAYRTEIRKLQEIILIEGKVHRSRIKEILDTWRIIKKIRSTNQYSNTTIKLLVIKEKQNFSVDQDNFERDFEQFLEEILLEQLERVTENQKSMEEEAVRNNLVQRFKESFRPPGEPIIQFSLNDDNEMTKIVEDSKEITRRNAVSSTKLAIKVVCNKIEVCRTKTAALNHNFTCDVNETIYIQLVNVPKYITIEIVEQSKYFKRSSGQLNIKLPTKNVYKGNRKMLSENFDKQEDIQYKHNGIGSGIDLHKIIEEFGFQANGERILHTSGIVTFSIWWESIRKNNSVETDFDPTSKAINKIIDKNGAIDIERLSEWMQTNKPDPQDPKNSILYEYALNPDFDQDFNKKNKYFRINPYLHHFQFCEETVLDENLRLKILQLRDENEPEFDRMAIPNRVKEIPAGLLEEYKRRISAESTELLLPEDDDEDEISTKRSRGKKFLKQCQIKVFQKCKNTQNNLTFEDVIDEKFLNYFEKAIKVMASNFINWFRWHPFSTPLPSGQKPSQDWNMSPEYQVTSQTKIVMKIISAINLPEKNDKTEINPYVEINFNNTMARTRRTQGANPSWNEDLIIPLEFLHNDYLNPNSLSGAIVVNIFDESETVLVKFGGIKAKRWLGYLEIPLAAICAHGIDGMIKVITPSLLLGYKDKEAEKLTPRSSSTSTTQGTYINICATVLPNIPKLNPSIEELGCSEIPYLKEHALKWNESYNLNYPDRKFSVFAIDINATTTCIVRYINPLEPPQINVEGFDVTPEQCARFISLIPFTECNQFYQNIWLTVDQFLNLMIGSVIDHAVALTCFLLALKVEAWLLLGFGIPYGPTAFVLAKEYDGNGVATLYIFDVVHGEKIYLTDIFCPLQKIYCVVNDMNIWANTQSTDNLNIMRFDFTRRSDWLPLFNKQVSAPTTSVHGTINYSPIFETNQLEIALDRKIRKKLSKLRQLDRTIWNHQISNVFKVVLNSFENHAMYGKTNSEVLMKLKECATTYDIIGHVFNSPFSNVSALVKKVKSFGLHFEEDPNAQFASAVYLKSYPNQVLTVWIFVAAIKEKAT